MVSSLFGRESKSLHACWKSIDSFVCDCLAQNGLHEDVVLCCSMAALGCVAVAVVVVVPVVVRACFHLTISLFTTVPSIYIDVC